MKTLAHPEARIRNKSLHSTARRFAFNAFLLVGSTLFCATLAELFLWLALESKIIRTDRGFGAFAKQFEDAQLKGFSVLKNYEGEASKGQKQGIFRLSDDISIGWEPTPGIKIGHIRINSAGFRGREYSHIPPPGVCRIAFLGDSDLFGLMLKESETIAGCLETHLNRIHNKKRFEVLNFGVPGYNTEQELETLQRKSLIYNPSVVVLLYCFNDAELSNRNIIVRVGSLSHPYLGLFLSYYLN